MNNELCLAFFFFLKIALAILGLLWFHIKFKTMCYSSVKDMGILIGFVLNLWIAFGSMDILTRLILQSENMGYLFICLNHIQFSLSMLYHF